MLEDIVQFAIAGDWHGNSNYAVRALNYAHKNGAEVIIHVGDFGVTPRQGFINHVNNVAEQLNMHVLFVDGNHEHHDWLNAQPIDEDGVRRLASHVWHLPRGFRWEWCGVTFVALGGAYSVDQTWRVPHVDWFPDEIISITDAYKTVEGGIADVMITHDAPNDVALPLRDSDWIPPNDLVKANRHRDWLGQIVDNVRPKHLFHGHYHVKYDATRINVDGTKTIVHGLDMDKRPFEDNMVILTIFDFI